VAKHAVVTIHSSNDNDDTPISISTADTHADGRRDVMVDDDDMTRQRMTTT
jgi:hypothetical protein